MCREMASDRRYRIDVRVGDKGIAGTVTDEDGRVERFEGWLALIAILEGGSRVA
jgi:hypothetical protein